MWSYEYYIETFSYKLKTVKNTLYLQTTFAKTYHFFTFISHEHTVEASCNNINTKSDYCKGQVTTMLKQSLMYPTIYEGASLFFVTTSFHEKSL